MIKETKKFLNKDTQDFSIKDIKKLQKLIEYHSDLYYNKQNPIISDYEYDKLFKKLEVLEEEFKYKIGNYYTKIKVGAEVKESSFKKVIHSRSMISLDNTYNEEDLFNFDERVKKNLKNSKELIINNGIQGRFLSSQEGQSLKTKNQRLKTIEYSLELKFDGLGIELIYENGKFIQAITRGNGVEGEDVTENIRQIENIPKKVDYKEKLEVRGEVIMPISVFEELNRKALKNGEKVFSNPRNAASGSVRTKDINITKQRKLRFFAYDLANFDEFCKKENKTKYNKIIEDLNNLGFSISPYFYICKNIDEVINYIRNFGDKKKQLDFEIDGLVVKVNNIDLWKEIGWTLHHPRYAIAYKFPAEILTTKILSVVHQVGKTGTITPVANLEAINISGAIIKRATLHNYEEVEKLGIYIGDYVFIKRAGEVIPKIVSLASTGTNRKKITYPKYCPNCNTLVKKDEDKVRYYCPNKNCDIQIVEKLIYAVGKNGFNIDGLGDKQIRKFYKQGFIRDLGDIFEIKRYQNEILDLEGFQEKSVNKILENIEKSRNTEISVLINSLSISGVGKKTSQVLSKLFISSKDLLNFSYTLKDIEELEDIGPEIAQNIINFFKDKENKILLKKLVNNLNIIYYKEKIIDKTSVFFEKKVCITGSFENYKRDDLVKILEEKGGIFVNTVSKKTDFLIAGEKAGSKLKKAKDFGVKVLSLDEFLRLI